MNSEAEVVIIRTVILTCGCNLIAVHSITSFLWLPIGHREKLLHTVFARRDVRVEPRIVRKQSLKPTHRVGYTARRRHHTF